MQPDRGFSLSHQKVALELAFSGVLAGYTELTIVPTNSALRHVYLHARCMDIQRVQIQNQDAAFEYADPMASLELLDIHAHAQMKRELFSAASQGAEGELRITLPDSVRPEPLASGVPASEGGATEEEFAMITIRIDYVLEDAHEAVQVVRPSADAPYRVPHIYTRPLGMNSSRCWVPCIDSLWDRCTWELEFVVPRRLSVNTGDLDDDAPEVFVVSSGELTEHAVHPHDPDKSVFYYTQQVATSVQHVAFCAGPFVLARLSPAGSGTCEALAFCLPEHEHELRSTTQFAWQAIEYISSVYGSYPFGSFKLVFVDGALVDCHTASTLAVCSSDLLHPPSVIDQAFENRHILSHAVAFQWVGINIVQKTWADTWLIHGLSQYLASMFLRWLLGNNEYRFRMKKDCDRLCLWDIAMPPLYQVGREEPLDPQLLPFVNLKAPLVLYLLDRRLCKMGASLGLGRVIPKLFLQAITGEMTQNALGTHSFLRTCKKVSGADLRLFVDQWINGSGCPRFLCTATFNRKKLLIEMHVRQESPAAIYAQAHPEDALASNPVSLWEGQMTVRIHEADGTPYEHVLDIKNEHQRYDVPFNTKYKRVRRNTKRFQARQAAAAAAAAGDEDAAEAIGMIDLGFGLGMWEDEDERKRWRVADWTEEDEAIMASAPYEWIRLDADFEWMAQIQFEQPDYMWVSQLQRDRDVVAQLAAVHALSQMPSLITSSTLTRTVLVTKYFYRIRAEAAYGLANCALPHLDLLGLFHLFMLFRTSYCLDVPHEGDSTSLEAPCIPKPNDFSDMADYFVRRALIHAIARVRDHRGRALVIVQRFLIYLLRYNDNSTNRFVDDYYLASIINALAGTLIPIDSAGYSTHADETYSPEEMELRAVAIQEVERLQVLDRLVPSYHNVVTIAALDFHQALVFANLRPLELVHFLEYTREGNFPPVRMAALNALLLLRGLQHKVLTRYYFAILASDEDHVIRMHLARSLCDALAVAIATGELGITRQRHEMLQEGDPLGNVAEQEALLADEAAQNEQMIKVLRREIGRSASVRDGFLAAFRASKDQAVARWALMRLAELLFKPVEDTKVPTEQTTVSVPAGEQTGAMRIRLMIKNAPQQEKRSTSHPLRVVLPKTAKPKKPKAPEPGQALGMSSSDFSACRMCIQKLMANKHCEPFTRPVDPVRDEAPDYFDVIKEPMDLSSVSNKLQSGQYKDRFQFKDDVDLIFQNAKTYTPDPKAWIHYEASRSESAFRQLWNRIGKALEQAAARAEKHSTDDVDEASAPKQPPSAAAGILPTSVSTTAPNGSTTSDTSDPVSSAPPPKKITIKLNVGKGEKRTASEAPPRPTLKVKRPRAEASSPPPRPPPAAAAAAATAAPGELESSASTKQSSAGVKSSTSAKPSSNTSKSSAKSKSQNSTKPSAITPSALEPKQEPMAETIDPDKAKSASEDPVLPGEQETPLHMKKVRSVLQAIYRTKEAAIFYYPIDPVRDNAPTYYEEIKYPMDLSKIDRKLKAGEYKTMGDFAADMRLMFANCRQFNPPGTEPAIMEQAVSRVWRREWSRAMVRKLEYSHKRSLQSMMGRLKQHPSGGLFLYAVDPVALGIPTYFDVIPQENARDLTLISDKLRSDRYDSIDALDADIQLMLSNCFTFNAGNEVVCDIARAFEKVYQQELRALRKAYS